MIQAILNFRRKVSCKRSRRDHLLVVNCNKELVANIASLFYDLHQDKQDRPGTKLTTDQSIIQVEVRKIDKARLEWQLLGRTILTIRALVHHNLEHNKLEILFSTQNHRWAVVNQIASNGLLQLKNLKVTMQSGMAPIEILALIPSNQRDLDPTLFLSLSKMNTVVNKTSKNADLVVGSSTIKLIRSMHLYVWKYSYRKGKNLTLKLKELSLLSKPAL